LKTLLGILALNLSLATGAMAAGPILEPASVKDSVGAHLSSEKFAEIMKSLPVEVAEKIAAAREAANNAKADLESLKELGKTPEEIKAMIAEKKAAALDNLQKALDALDGLPVEAKERVQKAKENIAKRIEERKTENP
jgi:hypothetical protein